MHDGDDARDEPRPERRRMRPEDRRRAILDAALAVFAEAGFGSASLNDVAEAAGVTKGCLYHHFDSKEALLVALLRDRARTAAIPDADAPDAARADVLRAVVHHLWRRYQEPGQLELTTVAVAELPRTPAVAQVLFDEVVSRNRAALRGTLGRLAPPSPDDELDAMLVPYMVMGAALGYRIFHGIDPMERAPDDLERALTRILLHGI